MRNVKGKIKFEEEIKKKTFSVQKRFSDSRAVWHNGKKAAEQAGHTWKYGAAIALITSLRIKFLDCRYCLFPLQLGLTLLYS